MAEPEQFEVLILGSGQGAGHAREWSHSNFKTQTFADGNTVSDFPLCASGEFYLVPSCARSGNTSAPVHTNVRRNLAILISVNGHHDIRRLDDLRLRRAVQPSAAYRDCASHMPARSGYGLIWAPAQAAPKTATGHRHAGDRPPASWQLRGLGLHRRLDPFPPWPARTPSAGSRAIR